MKLTTLHNNNNFLVWKRERAENGRTTKVPYSPLDGYRVGTDEPDRNRLSTYENALQFAQNSYDGVGFVFTQVTDKLYICGVDIDHQAPDSEFVKGITALFPNAYIELSPSGEGVHIVLLVDIARIPQKDGKLAQKYYSKNPKNGVECYVAGLTNRYFTHTGQTLQDGADVDQTDDFLKFLDLYMLRNTDGKTEPSAVSVGVSAEKGLTPSVLSDEELLQKARNAANGAKFRALFDNGDISGYESPSNADQALANILAFWTGKDPAQIERLFSLSALGQRDKWQRADYRRMTIDRAINDCGNVYNPKHNHTDIGDDEFLKPSDFTDVGESTVLATEYSAALRHSAATKFIVYDGKVWHENEARARGCLHELTQRQLDEHLPALISAGERLAAAEKNGGKDLIAAAEQEYERAALYQKFIMRCRNSKNISGVMREVQTPLEIDVAELDKDPFLLNTPSGEVDLRTGELLPHNPEHYHTKITAAQPSDVGADEWAAFLKVITCGDKSLENYLQVTSGQEAVGRVYSEIMEILYGTGRNGKSTYTNAKGRVLGDYVGQISAETLTTGRKSGKNYEIAGIRGKRLIIAPELEEGTRLDASFVKKICSTDKITGEKKYKDPFDFEPSHTVALFTNHLPRVGSNDAGTWRRLVVIPFNAVIEGKADIKNYAAYLYNNCGGAILKWIIEGAKKYIAADFHIEPPECVKQAIENYRQQNDWLNNYLAERCEIDPKFAQKSGELYSDYRAYCLNTGDYTRSAPDFKAAIESAGYETKKTKTGAFVYGLRLLPDNDFLGVQPL
jgi:P4 family phage/plasmid primase-like protien